MNIEYHPDLSAWSAPPPDSEFPQLNGHEAAWVSAIARGLGHQIHLLIATDAGLTTGILPLLEVKSLLFGKFLVSLPYINTGGPWAVSRAVAHELVTAACDLADRLDVRYLELRNEQAIEHPRLNACRIDKVHMRLSLPATDQLLDKGFKSKLRSQIKKTQEHQLSARWGKDELLADFYDVFAVNMRDLGTPVYSPRLFAEIIAAFGQAAEMCVIYQGRRAVAGGLLIHSHAITEVPSASSLRAFNSTGANMFMYRQLLARAIQQGSHTFDFGRSSLNSGTYRFKEQWGAHPYPSFWQYYVRKGSAEEMRPDSGGKARLVELWKRLPVRVARAIGPWIVRGIP